MQMLKCTPKFAGVLLRTHQSDEEETGDQKCFNVHINVVPDTFIKGVQYQGETRPSAVADEWADMQIKRGSDLYTMGVSDPQGQCEKFKQLIEDSAMPNAEKAKVIAFISEVYSKGRSFGAGSFLSVNGINSTPKAQKNEFQVTTFYYNTFSLKNDFD